RRSCRRARAGGTWRRSGASAVRRRRSCGRVLSWWVRSAVDAHDDGAGGVAGGAAGEQAGAAAAVVQRVDELGDGPGPGGALRVAIDERGPVGVHALEREARLPGAPQ